MGVVGRGCGWGCTCDEIDRKQLTTEFYSSVMSGLHPALHLGYVVASFSLSDRPSYQFSVIFVPFSITWSGGS